MIRADWQKRRLQNVEADLYRTLLAETPGTSLAAALLSDSPAAKLLARVQRQIAAFERTWYRANTELRRARAEKAEPATDGSLDRYLDILCAPPAPGELASFRPIRKHHPTRHQLNPESNQRLAADRRKNRPSPVLRRLKASQRECHRTQNPYSARALSRSTMRASSTARVLRDLAVAHHAR